MEGHPLGGKAGGRDERLGHAHRHGDDIGEGEQGLRVGGPQVGMLGDGRRHGHAAVVAAGARRAGAGGGDRGERGVTGYACEGRMSSRPGRTRRTRRTRGARRAGRARVREGKMAEGRVVVLVVGQEGRRVVVVVLVVVEGRPWKTSGDIRSRHSSESRL